jgi:predicted DCC family thiol-disulfide oxidoreductase YuxK
MLYDGACPLCMKEVDFLRRRDAGAGRIDFVDIADPGYSAAANAGISYEQARGRRLGAGPAWRARPGGGAGGRRRGPGRASAEAGAPRAWAQQAHSPTPAPPPWRAQAMEKIHAIERDGRVITGIEVFRRLYEAVGLGWVYSATKNKAVEAAANAVYDVWAKYRTQVGAPARRAGHVWFRARGATPAAARSPQARHGHKSHPPTPTPPHPTPTPIHPTPTPIHPPPTTTRSPAARRCRSCCSAAPPRRRGAATAAACAPTTTLCARYPRRPARHSRACQRRGARSSGGRRCCCKLLAPLLVGPFRRPRTLGPFPLPLHLPTSPPRVKTQGAWPQRTRERCLPSRAGARPPPAAQAGPVQVGGTPRARRAAPGGGAAPPAAPRTQARPPPGRPHTTFIPVHQTPCAALNGLVGQSTAPDRCTAGAAPPSPRQRG